MGRAVDGWFDQADAFLLGRKTYDIFAGYWPGITDETDPIATRLNKLPKYVASRSLTKADWANTTILGGDVPAVAKLKTEPGRELQVHGSGALVQSLFDHGFIDEYRLLIYPVVLGEGKRLFTDGRTPTSLKLIDAKTTSTGVAMHTYQPVGEPTYGSVARDAQ